MSEKIKKLPLTVKVIICVSVSFVISFSSFYGMRSPFSVSAASGLSPIFSVSVMLGGIISCVIKNDLHALPFAFMLSVTFLFRCITKKNTSLKSALRVFLITVSGYVVYGFTDRFEADTCILFLTTGILSAAVSYYICILEGSQRGIAFEFISNKQASAVIYFAIISICSSLTFWDINVGEIFAVLIVLVYARNYKFAGGGTAGVIAAAALLTGSDAEAADVLYLGIAGVVAGAFVNYGRPSAASAFLITSVVCILSSGLEREQVISYVDIALACIMFCFIPVEKLHNEEKRICVSYDEGSELIRLMSFRMRKTAESLENAVLSIQAEPGKKQQYGKSLDNRIMEITEEEYINISRNILRNQLYASSEILNNLSGILFSGLTVDKRMTERMKKCFMDNDLGFTSLIVYYNREHRMFAEVFCSKNSCISGYMIYKVIRNEFGKSFECTKCYDNDEVRFLISERPVYNLETKISQKSSVETGKNGDTCDCFRDDYGNVYMVISDGMGTGEEAAVYSGKTSALFRKLILGGVDVTQSMHIINSIIMTHDSDDSFATLDVAVINLDSGKMTIYKSGAAPTLLMHSGSVFSVRAGTYPLGISDNPGPFYRSFPLKAGDTIAMISDGVPEETFGIIKRELTDKMDVGDISDNICRIARKISSDDISVIAAKLIRQ